MSDQEKEILETSTDLISKLEDHSDTREEVKKIMKEDPFLQLRTDLLEFFRNRISEIQKHDNFIKEIEDSLRVELEEGDLTFDDKMRLYKMISSQAIASQEGILSLFRPTPGAPSILAQNLSEKEEKADRYEELFNKLSSKDLQKMDKLSKFLDNFSDEDSEED